MQVKKPCKCTECGIKNCSDRKMPKAVAKEEESDAAHKGDVKA